jgi:hypothetical protein
VSEQHTFTWSKLYACKPDKSANHEKALLNLDFIVGKTIYRLPD